MNTIVAFIKEIFTFSDNGNEKVGLSQFKNREPQSVREQNVVSRPGEIRLSELMKKSY